MDIDQNEFFRQATIRICGNLDIETAMKDCMIYMQNFLPIKNMELRLFDPGLNVLRSVAMVSSGEAEKYAQMIPMLERDWNERIRWHDEQKGIRIFNDPSADPEFSEICRKMDLVPDFSLMFIPLKLKGHRIGALSLIANGFGRYTEAHTNLISLLHEPFSIAMSNALQHQEMLRLKDMLIADNDYLKKELRKQSEKVKKIIGIDFGLRNVMRMVMQVAPMNSPVMFLGETGVGKGVFANALHFASERKDGPFIRVNCGAIPDNLIDSELFGHEKGSFTGANTQKKGRFERAHGGTIFLDEIGELPLKAQVRLLHVLQYQEIERVGGNQSIPVDVRIISATNRNLINMMAAKEFREDLWFRLNVFPIMIPPLRQRKEDLPALVHFFIDRKTKELKLKEIPKLGAGAIERLSAYPWPGNIRELENVIERELILCKKNLVTFKSLEFRREDKKFSTIKSEKKLLPLNEAMTEHIQRAMKLSGGKINGSGGAAEFLKIHPNTLRRRMDKLDIPYGKSKQISF